MLPTKIVVIGAGSAIFGLNTLAALTRSPRLRGSHLALVDLNAETLALMARLAERVNQEWDSGMTTTTHTHHVDALDGAAFVVSAIEVPPREKLWRQDYEITLKHGVRQPYAENGGPGGFAHAARNIQPVLQIAHDMEAACPDAWFINYTNPMMRICDAVHRYSAIKVVGLCHQIHAGYGMVGLMLADHLGIDVPEGEISTHAHPQIWPLLKQIAHQALERVDIKAAGLNHFTWMLDVKRLGTWEDMYPLIREEATKLYAHFEPLTQHMFKVFNLLPVPGDCHLSEYLPYTFTQENWFKYNIQLYDFVSRDS